MALGTAYLMTDSGGGKKKTLTKKEQIEQEGKFIKDVDQKKVNTVYTGDGNETPINLPYAGGTPTYTNLVQGVSQGTMDTLNSSFAPSTNTTNAQNEANSYLENVKKLGSVTDIVDQSTWDKINSTYQMPSAIASAWDYTNGLLAQLSTGKTSYSDQVKEMMDKIQNREKFEYDVDSDMLFQQYLASSMASGKTAMQDTMGQASALTGGYGSTYATSAANQQYNAYIQDAYNNLPEYYQMAMEAYQMEGQEMYNQLAMLNEADATEYQRLYNSWNANFSNTQQMYQNSYNEWQGSVNNAVNSANLQLNEHGQIFDQAYNSYVAVSNNAQQMYQNEYNAWADEVNNAFKVAQMSNADYWNSAELTQRQNEHEDDMTYKNRALTLDQEQFIAKNDVNGDGVVDSKDQENKLIDENGNELKPADMKYKDGALEAYNEGGEEGLWKYISSMPSDVETDSIIEHVYTYGKVFTEDQLKGRTFTKKEDTVNGFLGLRGVFGGVDTDDVVVDQYGNVYKIDQLPESIRKKLTDLKKDESYTVGGSNATGSGSGSRR